MAKRKANKKSADDLVKAFGLPKSAPPKAYSDPLGCDEAPFKPPVPLLPQYVRGSENWFVDAPIITDGVIPIKRLAKQLAINFHFLGSKTLNLSVLVAIVEPSYLGEVA